MPDPIRAPARSRVVGVVLVAVAAPALLALLFATPTGVGWDRAVRDAVEPWGYGPWRVLRGGLKWITPPAVSISVVCCLVYLARAGRFRTLAVALVLGAGAFLTSEAIKHGLLPFPSYGPGGTRNLSGHVAMTASAVLVWVLTSPARHRCWIVGVSWVLLAGASLGIIVSRWHVTGDVVITLAVATAWVLVGRAALRVAQPGRAATDPVRGRFVSMLTVGFGACLVGPWLLVTVGDAATGASMCQALAATVLTVVAAVTVTMMAVCSLASSPVLVADR